MENLKETLSLLYQLQEKDVKIFIQEEFNIRGKNERIKIETFCL